MNNINWLVNPFEEAIVKYGNDVEKITIDLMVATASWRDHPFSFTALNQSQNNREKFMRELLFLRDEFYFQSINNK